MKIFNVGKTGFKTRVFEKHFISYSCILFIKFNAMRSFCTKLLCFFKKKFFPEFRLIKPIFQSIEIAIKNFGQPLSVSIDAQLILDQSKHFRSIEPNFQSIENRIENFLKHLILTCSNTFLKSFQTLSLSIRSVKAPINIFCRFLPFFLQGFSPLRPVRHFYPSFCIYLHVSSIKSCDLGKISNLRIFGVFDDSICFS